MSKKLPSVQKMDVQQLDILKNTDPHGTNRVSIRRRSINLNFWRGLFSADETVTTVEPNNDRK
jgi:hypothetical protein